ncbi:hypothetical protein CAEBREN_19910 [Caenorhabditis brenneri]|uniref:Uncharacterized protein n=1 Tax=Caenorhabditis brenneri TaxID=135651 RepID=G0NNT1_CAEBE|nr:hypothetical protein CAEBREN_19910 [Caenorhabditis brenneri]
MALARVVTALDSFNFLAENVLSPNFSTAIQNAQKTDEYAIRRILKDDAYNMLLGLFKAWKNLNM